MIKRDSDQDNFRAKNEDNYNKLKYQITSNIQQDTKVYIHFKLDCIVKISTINAAKVTVLNKKSATKLIIHRKINVHPRRQIICVNNIQHKTEIRTYHGARNKGRNEEDVAKKVTQSTRRRTKSKSRVLRNAWGGKKKKVKLSHCKP